MTSFAVSGTERGLFIRPVAHAKAPSLIEQAFAIGSCVIFGTNALQVLIGLSPDSASTPVSVQLTYIAIYIIAGLYLVLNLQQSQRVFQAPLVLALSVFPLVSVLWSISPDETFRRAVALAGTSLFGIYLGVRFPLPTLIRILSLSYAIVAFASLATIVAMPAIGKHLGDEWSGAWRGLFFHKNGLGPAAALGAIILIFGLTQTKGMVRLMLLAAIGAMILMLSQTRSTSGLVAFTAMLFIMVWSRMFQKAPSFAIALSLFGLVILGLASLEFLSPEGMAEIMGMFGKSAEISGRTPLWALAWESIERRPWLGYGYEGFWVKDLDDVKRIGQLLYYFPHYSHNGLVETLLNGGIVLTMLVVGAFVTLLVRSVLYLKQGARLFMASFPFAFCAYFLLANLVESKILARNDLAWAIFIALNVFLILKASDSRAGTLRN